MTRLFRRTPKKGHAASSTAASHSAHNTARRARSSSASGARLTSRWISRLTTAAGRGGARRAAAQGQAVRGMIQAYGPGVTAGTAQAGRGCLASPSPGLGQPRHARADARLHVRQPSRAQLLEDSPRRHRRDTHLTREIQSGRKARTGRVRTIRNPLLQDRVHLPPPGNLWHPIHPNDARRIASAGRDERYCPTCRT